MSEPALLDERLDPRVRWVWRLEGAGTALVAFGVCFGLSFLLDDGTLQVLAAAVVPLVVLAVALGGAELRWRRWALALDDERLDVRHGAWTVARTLVPMRRVQHVDTDAGVLERAFGVARVVVHTAGGSVEVPGLARERAAALATRIAALAGVDDD